jgi:glycosyltransferase involved in cell wall biosynthesis
MRVLLATPSYFPIVGGSEVLTRILSIKLNEMGINADIMTINMNKKWKPLWREEITRTDSTSLFKEPALNPLPNLPNPLSNLFRVNVFPRLDFVSRFKDYDVIHFVGEADLSLPFFSRFIKKPKILHCVAIFRNGGLYKYYMHDRAFFGKMFRKIFPSLADLYIINSDEEKELLSNMGVPKDKISILPLGVDTEAFQPDQKRKIDNLVLFVGRIDRIKGLHILIEALAHVEVPVQLAIIGPKWNAEYVKEIEETSVKINRIGFHKVMFLGNKDQKDLVPWYQKASILACPYLYETYSNVIRESLACGTPVISTGAHLVKDCSDGILLSDRDPKNLAKGINTLLKDKQMRERFGSDGRKTIERHFSWKSIVEDLAQIYENMLS